MGTAPFAIKLNEAGKSQFGGDTVYVDIRFGMTPAGHGFQLWVRTGNGPSQMYTSYGDWYQGDIIPIIAEMNAVGMIEFIKTKVAPWVIKAMKNVFGPYVIGVVSVPVIPGNTVITLTNLDAIANGTLAMFTLVDKDNDGLPELIKV